MAKQTGIGSGSMTGMCRQISQTATASDNTMTVYIGDGTHDAAYISGGQAYSFEGQWIASGNTATVVLEGATTHIATITGGSGYTDSLTEKAIASGNTVIVEGNGGTVYYVSAGSRAHTIPAQSIPNRTAIRSS